MGKKSFRFKFSAFILSLLAFLFLGIPKLPERTLNAKTNDSFMVYVEKGIAKIANSETLVIGNVKEGTVLDITLDESKIKDSLVFSHWKGTDGNSIFDKSFRAMINQNIVYYPVFKDVKGNFSEWSVFKDIGICNKTIIYMREDKALDIKEYKAVNKYLRHDFTKVIKIDENYHKKICSKCDYEEKQSHNFVLEEEIPATLEKEGKKIYKCKDCGYVKEEIIPKLKPTGPSEWVIVKESINGKPGIRKRTNINGEEESYYYIDINWKGYFENNYIKYDEFSNSYPSASEGKELHFSYVNSDGNKAYIYAFRANQRDAEHTYAFMYIDDESLKNRPIYLAKSYGKSTSYAYDGFNWSKVYYVSNFDEYIDYICSYFHSSRDSSLLWQMRSYADLYNESLVKDENSLPAGVKISNENASCAGRDCILYEKGYLDPNDGTYNLYDSYYVDKATGATLAHYDFVSRTNRYVQEIKPIYKDEEKGSLTTEQINNSIFNSDISTLIYNMNNYSNCSLDVSIDAPKSSDRYYVGVYGYKGGMSYYDYAYEDRMTFLTYYMNTVGYPLKGTDGKCYSNDYHKITLTYDPNNYAPSENQEFDHWEIYDWDTNEYKFLSDKIDYSFNYTIATSDNSSYITDLTVKDVTLIRAISREIKVEENKHHIQFIGGQFADNNWNDIGSDLIVDDQSEFTLNVDNSQIAEYKQLDGFLISKDNGLTFTQQYGYRITVDSDLIVKLNIIDETFNLYATGRNSDVEQIKNGVKINEEVEFMATPYEGYTFDGWYTASMDKSGEPEYEFYQKDPHLKVKMIDLFNYSHIQFCAFSLKSGEAIPNPIGFKLTGVDTLIGDYEGCPVNKLIASKYNEYMLFKDPTVHKGKLVGFEVSGTKSDNTPYSSIINVSSSNDKGFLFIESESVMPLNMTIKAQFEPCTEHQYDKWIEDIENDNHYRICINCGEKEVASHRYGDGVITKEATHLEEGIKTYTCLDCGHIKTEVIPKLPDHTFGEWIDNPSADNHYRECECGEKEVEVHTYGKGVITKEATHLEEGIKTYTCLDCGHSKTEVIPKLPDHTFGEWIDNPSADNHYRECECGEKEVEVHTYGDGVITKEATHLEEGIKTYTCTVCGHSKTEVIPKLPEHTFGEWIDNPEADNHYRECECGEKEVEAHTYGAGVITKEATHLEEGEMTYTCTVCGHSKTEVIPKLPEHTFGEWIDNPSADNHYRECECGEKEVEAHTYGKGVITKEATHLEEGEMTYTCTVCGHKKIESIDKLPGHTFGKWQPDPTREGHYRECECGYREHEDHHYDDGVIKEEPTHLKEGIKIYTCSECGYVKEEVIPKLPNHTFGEWIDNPEADNHYRECECGEKEVAEHNYGEWIITKEATCEEKGERYKICKDCNHKHVEAIEALGHSFTHYESDNNATYEKDGTKTATCDRCGEKDTIIDEGSKLGMHRKFIDEVNKIENISGLNDRYQAILEAINLYNSLDDSEKNKATEAYDKLLEYVNSYNSDAKIINDEHDNVTYQILGSIGSLFTIIGALLMLLKSKILI